MKYKIHVGRNRERIEKVLTTLFKYGYVFTKTRRIRDFNIIRNGHWWNDMTRYWEWIITGYDEDCKMVVGASDMTWTDFMEVSLEEFIKLNTVNKNKTQHT